MRSFLDLVTIQIQLNYLKHRRFLGHPLIVDIRNYDKEGGIFYGSFEINNPQIYGLSFFGRLIDTVHGLLGFMVKLSIEENFFFFLNPVANSEDLLWMNVKHEN